MEKKPPQLNLQIRQSQEKYFSSSHIMEDLISDFQYIPNSKPFPNTNLDLTNTVIFSKIFPKYFEYIQTIDRLFTEDVNKLKTKDILLDTHIRKFLADQIEKTYNWEMINFTGKYWVNLRIYTKVHTDIFFFYTHLFISKPINQDILITEYDKNILYWTVLFHDIGKNQHINPYYKENFKYVAVDRPHPFKSIIIFISTLLQNNLILFENDQEKDEFYELFNALEEGLFKSYVVTNNPKVQTLTYNLSFSCIDVIDLFLCFLRRRNMWLYDCSTWIIFHQSWPNNTEHMNSPWWEEKYIVKYFSWRLIELMRIVMVFDSCSHSRFKGGNWVNEINSHLDGLRKLFE